MPSFEQHVQWALSTPTEGFDFTPVHGRVVDGALPWDFAGLARAAIAQADGPVLDLGTGGGEFLAGLGPFPPGSVATEGWPRTSREQSRPVPPWPRTACGSTPCRPTTRPGCRCPTRPSPSSSIGTRRTTPPR
ncbi:hypothetical protein [Occultella kanbiaonis]|uniref:hypothetical protein n=1 Tax=Occultella kanbiaonis TaxID=2675754 RepID=UPI0013D31567|nr:hypothetical protein [Occultella kanbiaonis]